MPAEIFDVVRTLPGQTSHTDGRLPRHCWPGCCSPWRSVHRNAHAQSTAIVSAGPASPLFFRVCGLLIFWEHPVCAFNAGGQKPFILTASRSSSMALNDLFTRGAADSL